MNEEKFSDDYSENLRIENEILKLKMQAESGAYFGGENELPPEIEKEFLLQVQAFEEAWKDVKNVSMYDLLGQPPFKEEKELSDEEIPPELDRLNRLIAENQNELSFLGEYEPRVRYKFITEEFFRLEVEDFNLPGMTRGFIYEDFYPNHQLSIKERTMEFLEEWFEMNFSPFSWQLDEKFILPDGKILSKEEVLNKIQLVTDSYSRFTDCSHSEFNISYQWDDKENRGLGHAEGYVKYHAVLENGESVPIEGPFKLYFSSEYDWWQIYYFIFPGFVW
jgi:hypothetical protein